MRIIVVSRYGREMTGSSVHSMEFDLDDARLLHNSLLSSFGGVEPRNSGLSRPQSFKVFEVLVWISSQEDEFDRLQDCQLSNKSRRF